ncbi:MAG: hypothetical protein WBV78_08120 [Roseobacter sp.]
MTPAKPSGWGGLLLRLVALVALVLAATWASHLVREALHLQVMPENEQQVHRMVMLGMAAYISLLTIPFVPGAEIGIAMLTAFGAVIAPLVYVATVTAMLLAYLIGRLVQVNVLVKLLTFLRLQRAADFIAQAAPLSREDRLRLLLDGAPSRVVSLTLRHRYVALALAVNLPGNALIGGGGGIMMVAGMSGLFAPLPTVLAVMIAVSPVPLAVYAFGF